MRKVLGNFCASFPSSIADATMPEIAPMSPVTMPMFPAQWGSAIKDSSGYLDSYIVIERPGEIN